MYGFSLKVFENFFSKTRFSVRDLVLLDKTLNREYWYVEKIEESDNPAIEAISILSDGISSLLKYAENVNLFYPVDFHFNYHFTARIPGLVKDLSQDLKILFEDILIRLRLSSLQYIVFQLMILSHNSHY